MDDTTTAERNTKDQDEYLVFPATIEWYFYAIGSLASCPLVLLTHITDRFPFLVPFSFDVLSSTQSAVVLTMTTILVTVCYLHSLITRGEVVGLAYGMLASAISLGLYTSPWLLLHPKALGATLCLSVAVWFLSRGRNRDQRVVWVVSSVAGASFLTVALGMFGLAPIASSSPSSATAAMDTEAKASELVRDLHDGTPVRDRDAQEMASIMQQLAHVEASRFGIPSDHEPRVVICPIGSDYGKYVANTNTICVSPLFLRDSYVSSAGCVVELIAHETAHAFEWAAIQGWAPESPVTPLGEVTSKDIENWRSDFATAKYDLSPYVLQDTEKRAQDHAKESVKRYYDAAELEVTPADTIDCCEILRHLYQPGETGNS